MLPTGGMDRDAVHRFFLDGGVAGSRQSSSTGAMSPESVQSSVRTLFTARSTGYVTSEAAIFSEVSSRVA